MDDTVKRKRTTIYKRNKKKLEQHLVLYPDDVFFSRMPQSCLEQRYLSIREDDDLSTSSDTISDLSSRNRSESSLGELTQERRRIDCSEEFQDGNDGDMHSNPDNILDSSDLVNSSEEVDLIENNLIEDPTTFIRNKYENIYRNEEEEEEAEEEEEESNSTETEEDNEESASNVDCKNDSSANDEDNDNNQEHCIQNRRFFRNPKITYQLPFTSKSQFHERDHLLAAISLSLRRNSTYEDTLNLLEWIKLSHDENTLPTTKKALWKALNRDNSIVYRHLYCHECNFFLGTAMTPTEQCPCGACGPDEDNKMLNYFLEINLRSQLSEFLNSANCVNLLKYRFTRRKQNIRNIKDMYDGEEYKRLRLPGNFLSNKYNYSLTFNTDGCKVANSSNASAWPVYVQINELPPHARKKYMFLAAIFVDDKHPSMNTLLRPFSERMKKLYSTGIVWKPEATEVTSKFIITTCTVDSPARSLVTRTKQFNEIFGCSFCYAEGDHENKHIYPIVHCFKPLRTDSEMRRDMIVAHTTGTIVNGVKGISSLVALPKFDICKGMVVESMHAIFLGVVRQHTALLINETKANYYIGSPTNQKIIDDRLSCIKPPTRHSRLPRAIKTMSLRKASEWRNWLDYAPVVLEGILRKEYIKHIALISRAIHYLNSDSITSDQLDIAEDCLVKYVKLFEQYFGKDYMSFNVHLLTHLTNTVRNWGPMWVHSAFTFEAWNKKIINKVTSPHSRTDQIVTRFLMTKFIEYSVMDSSICEETKNIINKIYGNDNKEKLMINEMIVILGNGTLRAARELELSFLENLYYEKTTKIICYDKMKINGTEYRPADDKETKFCNSVVFCKATEEFGEIVSIVKFYQIHGNEVYGFLIKLFRVIAVAFDTDYIKKCEVTEDYTFISAIKTVVPATKIVTINGSYIFKIANCWESD